MVDTQQIFLKFGVGGCVDEYVMARENSYKIWQSYSPFSKHLSHAGPGLGLWTQPGDLCWTSRAPSVLGAMDRETYIYSAV